MACPNCGSEYLTTKETSTTYNKMEKITYDWKKSYCGKCGSYIEVYVPQAPDSESTP